MRSHPGRRNRIYDIGRPPRGPTARTHSGRAYGQTFDAGVPVRALGAAPERARSNSFEAAGSGLAWDLPTEEPSTLSWPSPEDVPASLALAPKPGRALSFTADMDRHLPTAPVPILEDIPILLPKDDSSKPDALYPSGGDGGPLAQASELNDDEINQALLEMLGQVASQEPLSMTAAERPQHSGAPNPPPQPTEDAHSVFDRMGLAMRQPTTFNLGRINMDREFDAIEAGIDFDELTGSRQERRRARGVSSGLSAAELADDELAAELSALLATPATDPTHPGEKARAYSRPPAAADSLATTVPVRPAQVTPPVLYSVPTAQAHSGSVPVSVAPACPASTSAPLQAASIAASTFDVPGVPVFATQAAWAPHPGYVVPPTYAAHFSSLPPGSHPTLFVAQPAPIFSAPPMVAAVPLPAGAVPMSAASPSSPETSNG